MITVAIIGILAGTVLVSTQGSMEKSRKASAITTASSVLPELVACQDDGGFAKNAAPVATNPVCCTAVACGAAFAGHTVTWPDVTTKTGWAYGATSGALSTSNYVYTLTKTISGVVNTITCSYATNDCN